MTNPGPSRKRWRIAFTVAVLFTAVGCLFAWRAYKRDKAIEAIEQVGGTVSIVIEIFNTRHPWRSRLGIERELLDVNLDGTDITDEDLECMNGLTNIRSLHLSNTKITDDGLRHLRGLKSLGSLYLDGTHTTDEGVKNVLEALPNCTLGTHLTRRGVL
mgnify:FL=1